MISRVWAHKYAHSLKFRAHWQASERTPVPTLNRQLFVDSKHIMPSIFTRSMFRLHDITTNLFFGKETANAANHFYDLMDRNMDGNDVNMNTYKGSVLCVVNVASQWGLTDANYSQLVKLHDEYHSQGFKILAFPCNQFGGQEPVSLILTTTNLVVKIISPSSLGIKRTNSWICQQVRCGQEVHLVHQGSCKWCRH